MLPHYLWRDFSQVLYDLQEAGYPFEDSWFAPHYEFRFPAIGAVRYDGVLIELRTAIEPWYVLGEEPAGGGTVRFVDSSIERLEVHVQGFDSRRHQILCNGWIVPLRECGSPDTWAPAFATERGNPLRASTPPYRFIRR